MKAWLVCLVLLASGIAFAQTAAPGSGSATDIGSAGSGFAGSADVGSAAAPRIDLSADAGSAAVGSAAPAAPTHQPTIAPAPKTTTKEKTVFAIKVIGGLVVLVILAYLGGNRHVVRFQEQLGIAGVITAGFPYVALGMIASLSPIGILTGDVLSKMEPILHFGLGWLGFLIGAQLDIRVLDRVPKGTAYLIVVEALGPFGITAAGCGMLMMTFGQSFDDPALWRDMILLGTAAAMTAPRKFRGFAHPTWHEGRGADVLLSQLDELVGIIGLLFITAYFRQPSSATWQLPDTAWIFVSLGLGVAAGALIFAMIRVPSNDAEFLALVLGGVAFASGLAGYLQLSPIVICCVAGVLVTNFPNDRRKDVFRILHHLERPVHLMFLLVVGAVWAVGDWRGWLLVPLFIAGRAIGKWVGIFASHTAVGALLPSGFAEDRKLITPMSGLSIALVISIPRLEADKGLPWVLTAVIGGSLATEMLMQRFPDKSTSEPDEREAAAPIDELDDLDSDEYDGPIYRDEVPPPPKPPTGEHP